MSQTLIATFDNLTGANRAVEKLVAEGFERSTIEVKAIDNNNLASTDPAVTGSTTLSSAAAREDDGVLDSIGRFFSDLFGGDDEREYANHYSEAVRRGKAVLAIRVDGDDERIDAANACLLDAGALDIDEQVSSWRSEGYQTTSSSGLAASAADTRSRTTLSGADTLSASSTSDAAGTNKASLAGSSDRENVIPVVQEDIEIGKRRVEQGRVRVVSHVESKQVHESVELQSEKAVIERRPVDRPASEADLSNLQDRTIEVRESAEKAVVNKTARVVEEVVVGKQVSTETKQIDDTVRRTEVSVERDGEADADHLATTSSFDTHRDRFRSDYEANYAGSGTGFDAYEPAYRSGFALRNDARYRGKEWDEIEPTAREQWEAGNPGTWERMREAYRRGWDWERS